MRFEKISDEHFFLNDDKYFFVNYSIYSVLHFTDYRYRQVITGSITTTSDEFEGEIEVGRLRSYKLLVDIASNAGESILTSFDADDFTISIGSEIYDFVHNDFNEIVDNHFGGITQRDVLILERIEIFPEYRGIGIGMRVIKDLYNNFIQGCGLLVLRCAPLQFEYGVLRSKDEFVKAMNYNQFPKLKRVSKKKLSDYFKSLGFENIKGISKDLLFVSAEIINEDFNSISLE